ncbi:hypothetical protein [Sporosarcina psychrophila]|uniref:Uncharacterized protein n=1 Tax=Sporosarcina psychrophila TaxID=1476 RepID=A0ABV2KGC4_SPOPS
MKKILGFLLILLSFSGSAYAEELISNQPTKEQKEIEQIIILAELEARDETYKELEFKNRLSNFGYLEDTVEFKDSVEEKVDKKIAEHGIKRIVEEKPEFELMASPPTSAIDVMKPNIYSSSQGYILTASAIWKKKSNGYWTWTDHIPVGVGNINVGGDDGLGVYFQDSTNIDVSTSSFYTYDESTNIYNSNLLPYRNNSSGVYYTAQDKMNVAVIGTKYTWHAAYLTIWPSFKGKVNTTARTQWTHTWSSAKITGATISPSGISVGISNAQNSWDGATTTGTTIIY